MCAYDNKNEEDQRHKDEHALHLAYLSAQNRCYKRRHRLSPMNMQDIAQAMNIKVSTLYRRLQKLKIRPKQIKAMSLLELVDFINKYRNNKH